MKKSKSSKPAAKNGLANAAGKDFLIAGIGASAGGIQALKKFFENVPADSGVAYVVILHLSPDHDSRLAEVLQTTAQIPVTQVKERVKVEPNHVYVVPPNQHLGMHDGHIIVEPNTSLEERRAPVDIFFRTLAESHHARAISVVLSGTGADGSMGLKRVKERGGAVFVQNPREAEFSEMPRNSIATELVDQVLNVGEIPAKIVAYKENLGAVSIQDGPESRPEDDQAALREIFAVLRVRTGHDFSNYKHPTVLRRIERRINVRELHTLADYAVWMRDDVNEPVALLKDLLISVTNFFRDKEAFQFLETEVVPRILQGKSSQNEIRVWVAGCATGEEAYSLAMLFCEQIENSPAAAPKIQIFATDIDEDAIASAREGFYTLVDAADVSPERLRRFFTKDGGGYRVRREMREQILFAKHNLLKDPPFSHLDLVTCRNLLIYLNGAAQERAMETFHFALNPGSFLFLGSSESIDGAGDLYAAVNKEYRIYQSRQAAAKIAYPVPDAPPAMRFEEPKKLPQSVTAGAAAQEQENRLLERISFGNLHQQLLEQYAPPSIVVNENHDIVHLSPQAGRFLHIAGGEMSKNLLHLIRPELRLELRTALFQAVQRRANVVAANLKVQRDGHAETINIQVRPVLRAEDTARGFLLVIFEPSPTEDAAETTEKVIASDEPIARRLEEELERTKSQLRTSVEQYEIQTEELRASNEELQAMNEELRSTAEELETSREELQSVNEELMTVNQELKIKIEELSVSNNDFKNLLNSTNIGTIFLDRSLRVKLFTPTVREVFNLIDADINRPLADITTKINFADLHHDVKKVLETLQTVEREFETDKGRWYLMRVFPYRTVEDKISGAVVTFIDITTRVRSEQDLHKLVQSREHKLVQSREQQRRIFETTLSTINDFAYIFDKDGRFVYSNYPLLNLLGITAEEIVGKNFYDLNYPADLAARLQSQIQYVFETKETVKDETPFTSPTGAGGFYEYIFNPVLAADGSVESVAGSTRDITTLKRSEINFAFLAEISQDLARLTTAAEIMENVGAKIARFFNLSVCAFTDVDEAANAATITHDWHRTDAQSLIGTYRMEDFLTGEFQRRARAGEVFVVSDTLEDSRVDWKKYRALDVGAFVSVPVARDGKWLFQLMMFDARARDWRADEIELMREITARIWTSIERRRADEALRESEERLQQLIKNLPGGAAFILDRDLRYLLAEGEALANGDFAPEDFIGKTIFEALPRDLATSYAAMYRKALAGESFIHETGAHGGTYLTRGTPLRSASGEVYAALAVSYDISDRKRAEEKLRESEERFRAMFEQANVGIVQLSADGRLLALNPGFCKIIGYDEAEARRRTVRDITHPDDYEREAELMRRLLAGEISGFSIEKRFVRQDGSIIWGNMTGTLMGQTNGGEPLYMLSIVEDISERKAAEESLRESETQMRLVVEAAEMGTWDWNLTSGAVHWNDQHFRLFGLEPENRVLTYTDFEQGVHPDDRAAVRERLEQAIERDTVFQTEFRAVLPDGSTRWMSGYGRVVEHDREGRAARMTGVMFDATERKATEEAVRESKERLQLLVESASDYAIFTITPENIVDSWNAGAEKVFGWQEDEIIGKSGAILFTPEDRAAGVSEQEKNTAAAKGRAEDERWHIRKDGSRFYASGVMRPLKDGAVEGFVKIARDMTDKLAAEKAQRDKEILQKLVGAQEDERKRIARDLHDHLGQQLTALRLKLEATRKLCENNEVLSAKIDETQILARHIDDDVDFLAWELRPAALDDLGLTAALDNYAKEWSRHSGITSEFYTSGLGKKRLVPEIETNLYRIAQEALNNVSKHAGAKSVNLILEKRGSLIILIVEDDGTGFDVEDKYNRSKGLGLIGMQERAALVGGKIQIESTPDKGTTVFVRIPAEELVSSAE